MDNTSKNEVYRILFETSPNAMFIADEEGHFLDANPAACREMGYRLDEVLTMRVEIVLPGSGGGFREIAELVRREGHVTREAVYPHRDGRQLPIDLNARQIPYGTGHAIFGVARDISVRYRLESALAYRGRILDAVARAGNLLLSFSGEREAIDGALEILGRTADVDRVFLFEAHSDPESGMPAASLRYEWTREGISKQIDKPLFQNMSFDLLPRWRALLLKGEPVMGRIRDFPEEERRYLEPELVRATIVFPILISGWPWGFVGFDDCREERVWNAEEQALLSVAARSIGGAIARQRLEQKLQRAKRLQEGLQRLRESRVSLNNQQAYFERVCQEVMSCGLFRMTWIGWMDEITRQITPTAHAGYEEGYLLDLTIPLENTPLGRGPCGTAARLGSHRVCNNIARDPTMAPRREAALARGYRTVGAFPFHQHREVAGILVVYTEETGWFSREEVLLLDQFADSISASLDMMETERQRDWALEAMGDREQYLRAIWDSVYTGILVLDAETHVIIDANPLALTLLGLPEDRLMGRCFRDFIRPVNMPRAANASVTPAGAGSKHKVLSANGEAIPVLRTTVPMELHGCKYLMESLVDIRGLRP